ncbi:DUF2474 family protein [Acetobacter fallax]|uniref:DUF2474 family protein n=1 Tax=Acetobacter fallax TaxID=1737473 RepID=A0ABX0K541_9PROT|nr:DUF2474 family protein [Acetobacter fallax]NHO31399.1 DUF2474 family protein [Acetobacter fallax]NHO35019.1 DUF2474 family protein [Acetobacter fallax]
MQDSKNTLPVKLLWFAGLWLAGVATLGVVAGALHLIIHN